MRVWQQKDHLSVGCSFCLLCLAALAATIWVFLVVWPSLGLMFLQGFICRAQNLESRNQGLYPPTNYTDDLGLTKIQDESQRKVGIAFIEGRTPQGPAHGQVSVLPGISTCHQLKVSGTCKAHSEGGGRGRSHQGPGAGWTGRESGTGQVFMSAQMGQPVSLGLGGARTPWERGGQQHPERGSTGLRNHWVSGEVSDLQNPPALPTQNVCLLPCVWVFRAWVQEGHRRHLQGEPRLEGSSRGSGLRGVSVGW